MEETTLLPARKTFSRIGLALCAILVIATVLQLLWFGVPTIIWGENNWAASSSWGMWIGTFAPLYLIAIPVGLLVLRKLPAQAPEKSKLGLDRFLMFLPICFCLMYGGNIIGNVLSSLLSGGTAENAILDYAMDTNPLKVLVIVILARLLDEYVCRKQIIDRTRQYGEKTAVVLSAVVFGLLHQNLFQFFYAFGLGLVFAYIYTRTGRLRYSVILHSIINFMGSVVAPWILSLVNPDAFANADPSASPEQVMALMREVLPGLLLTLLYSLFLLGMSIAGLVLLVVRSKRVIWKDSPEQLPQGTAVKTVYLNVGMILYILICVATTVLTLV